MPAERFWLSVHAKRTGAGRVCAAETGFRIAAGPDTVRAPDVAFIIPERRLARDYGRDGSEPIVAETEPLDGEDVLPGFSCPLTTVL